MRRAFEEKAAYFAGTSLSSQFSDIKVLLLLPLLLLALLKPSAIIVLALAAGACTELQPRGACLFPHGG